MATGDPKWYPAYPYTYTISSGNTYTTTYPTSSYGQWNPTKGQWETTNVTTFNYDYTPETINIDIPLFADAATIRATLQKQLEILEELADGLEGNAADIISDTIYFLQESIKALEQIGQ